MLGLPAAFWYLWSGLLVNRLGGFIIPFLTLYLTEERHFPLPLAGALVSLYGAGSIVAGPVGGAVADRAGRRTTMLLATVLGASAMLQLGFARSTLHIAASTLLLGFLSEMYRPAANAMVLDVLPPESRPRGFAWLYWASNLGFAGATAIGGTLARRGFAWLFLLDAATTLAMGAIVYLRVPESHPGLGAAARPALDFSVPYRDRRFLRFAFTQLLVSLLFMQAGSSLPLDMAAHGLGPERFGRLIGLNGVLIVLLQPLSVRWVAQRSRVAVMAVGALLVGAGFGVTALAQGAALYAASIALWTLGEVVFTPVTPVVIGDMAPLDLRASYQGAALLAHGVAASLGPMVGTAVLARFGPAALWIACFAVGGVACFMHLTSGGYGPREERGASPHVEAGKEA